MFFCPSFNYIKTQQKCVSHLSLQMVPKPRLFFFHFQMEALAHRLHGAAVRVSMHVFMRTVRDYFLSDRLCEEHIQMCRLLPLSMQLT